KILDFGIAKMMPNATADASMTRVMGTPLYMSPEQMMGDGTIRAAADIYALSHIAYTLLTGEAYWAADYRKHGVGFSFMSKIMEGIKELPTKRARRRDVVLPAAFDGWLLAANQLDPSKRPSSATLLIETLAEALNEPSREVATPEGGSNPIASSRPPGSEDLTLNTLDDGASDSPLRSPPSPKDFITNTELAATVPEPPATGRRGGRLALAGIAAVLVAWSAVRLWPASNAPTSAMSSEPTTALTAPDTPRVSPTPPSSSALQPASASVTSAVPAAPSTATTRPASSNKPIRTPPRTPHTPPPHRGSATSTATTLAPSVTAPPSTPPSSAPVPPIDPLDIR
ncbi:MAG: hypothetical protein VB934_15390, partial [Polyangiaceae bacterium]